MTKNFNLDTADSGKAGLKRISDDGPYAVVVSDLKMPVMDGIQFLKSVREVSPDSVRMILTGHADVNTAIESVNEGNIFRFMTKPCPVDLLTKAIKAGIDQYRLIIAERELLEKTLGGSVKILTEILGLVNPAAFGNTIRIKRHVNHIVTVLKLPYAWQYELAAMLSMIGCVTIPPDTLEKMYAGMPLTDREQKLIDAHPHVARNLLEKIPRLGSIARMIENVGQPFLRHSEGDDFSQVNAVELGGHLITLAMAFDRLIMQGMSSSEACDKLEKSEDGFLPEAVQALKTFNIQPHEEIVRSVNVADLSTAMVLNQDIFSKTGMLIATKGQEITYTMLHRIRAFHQSIGVKEPFTIVVGSPIGD